MNNKRVKCVETGKVFNSVKEAAAYINRTYHSVSYALSGRIQTAGGYHWEYAKSEEEELPKPPKPSELRSKPRMSISEVQEEARRRTSETGQYTDYADIQKEETVRLIREGKLCHTKKRK